MGYNALVIVGQVWGCIYPRIRLGAKTPISHTGSSPFRLLFLCTGNYYRSRFAETLFNALAKKAGLNWTADSCGIATGRGVSNVGPISVDAVRGLEARGIVPEEVRFPEQVQEQDLRSADLVIALNEREHRLLLGERCLSWSERVEYWHVGDVGRALSTMPWLKSRRRPRG